MKKNVVIVGAGPAGLACALGLSEDPSFNIIIIEKLDSIGGLARTVEWNGYKMDLGGHRFFTKSDRVMKLWKEILPIQGKPSIDDILTGKDREIEYEKNGPDPQIQDKVMLIRKRTSRIYFENKFYDYPVTLNKNTIINLGFKRLVKIGTSYIQSKVFPLPETNLENFFINRFGSELYSIFFKDYTTKVWGLEPSQIKAEWGAQRVKGLSISAIIKDILLNTISPSYHKTKMVETTLIRRFFYPKFGPGQMWKEIAELLRKKNVKIITKTQIKNITFENNKIKNITFIENILGNTVDITVDYLISSGAIKDILSLFSKLPPEIKKLSDNLIYRDFITVGLLYKKMKIRNKTTEKTLNDIIPDNWIYLQDKNVIAGRLQIFNNWSPYLLKDINNVWLGVEYFCNMHDNMWEMNNREIINLAISDIEKTGICSKNDFIDGTVVRVEKAYPSYFGEGYENFKKIKDFLDSINNFYSIGRNGMHRYNNMDHSFLSGVVAADIIKNNIKSKDQIWQINTETEYLEEKKE